ncbi:hypothetical protein F5B19DRAFT_468652 [Rostrohypoxylon terebratum]|nr:hypothetical protein F5B19DRAFT_468652 [Rostrohypoxylon terebratum]
MSAKRTPSQANLEEHGNALKQTKITSMIGAPSNLPSTTDDDVVSQPAKKATAQNDPTAAKLYKDTLSEIDKEFNEMLEMYEPNPTPTSGVTSEDFAEMMVFLLPKARELAEIDPVMAFNLVLDLEGCVKASGWGNIDKPYQKLDNFLVSLINTRLALDENKGLVPGQEYKVEPPHEEVGVQERELYRLNRDQWKKRSPNKQARVRLERAHREDLRDLLERRRERRETAEDWAGNALNDLLETGGRIDQYGIGRDYFRKSIDLLAEVKGIERPSLPRPPRELWADMMEC